MRGREAVLPKEYDRRREQKGIQKRETIENDQGEHGARRIGNVAVAVNGQNKQRTPRRQGSEHIDSACVLTRRQGLYSQIPEPLSGRNKATIRKEQTPSE